MSFFSRIKTALSKTRSSFTSKLSNIFRRPIDSKTQEKLEETFFEADLGSNLTVKLIDTIKPLLRKDPVDEKEVFEALKEKVKSELPKKSSDVSWADEGPTVIFVVGVNGSGKTTTVAKLAYFFKSLKKSVLIAAADTFRAAATEQLEMWAKKVEVDLVKGSKDPSAVIFDAVERANAKKIDCVLVDTSGRLQTKTDLMKELEKMKNVASKKCPGAPHEVWLVIDASLGQNAYNQAEAFKEYAGLTGLVVTKLDGSSKGGASVAISKAFDAPIKFIGLGEGIDDFEAFDAEDFADGIFS